MSLVFAAITPHTPLLVPSIGKDNLKKITKTKEALLKLEEELYLSHPDTIIIISPHGTVMKDAFTVNFCSEYVTNLKEFGDLSTTNVFRGESHLPYHIRQASYEHGIKTILISNGQLDYGSSVPLTYLTAHLPNVAIMPIGFSDLDWKSHLEFGYIIKEQIMKSNRRFAVIASADLSHALTSDAPAGFNAKGPEFDAIIQKLLSSHNTAGMLKLEPAFLNASAECGFRSLLILMGVLRDVNYTYQSYAYEAPFGIGYLTAECNLA